MIKQIFILLKRIVSREPFEQKIEFEFSIYDAIAISVIFVIVWWLIFI